MLPERTFAGSLGTALLTSARSFQFAAGLDPSGGRTIQNCCGKIQPLLVTDEHQEPHTTGANCGQTELAFHSKAKPSG
jgi:hypothetical protein